MKKALRISGVLFICICMIISCGCFASAENATVASGSWGTNITWIIDDAGTLLVSGEGGIQALSTNSSDAWMKHRSSIKNVLIENGVTSIGSYAFYGCFNMTSITFPISLTRIDSYAIHNATSLTDIFYNGSQEEWKNVSIAQNNIMTTHVHYCDSGSWGENISWSLQYHHLTISGTGAMNDFISYSSDAWRAYKDEIDTVVIQNGITSIGEEAFSAFNNLVSVTIPDSLEIIGNYSFYYCSLLSEVSLSDRVTSIGRSAFNGCIGLKKITIPVCTTNIEANAFNECKAMTDVYYLGTQDQWDHITIGPNNECLSNAALHTFVASGTCGSNATWALNDEGTLIISGTGSMSSYYTQGPWGNQVKTAIIEEGITNISSCAFNNCTELKSLTIPSTVASIGWKALEGCTGLTTAGPIYGEFSIKYGWTESIPFQAFCNLTNLSRLDIPEGITSIGAEAFSGCSSLTSVNLASTITSIGNSAFYNCSSLNDVQLPDSVTYIGENAFQNCPKLQTAGPTDGDYNIKLGWTDSIPSKAFYNMTSLKSVVIPDGVTTINRLAFAGCANLSGLTIPNSVYTIYHTSEGASPFSGCPGLKTAGPVGGDYNISLGWNRIIPQEAFYNFSELEKVVIPTGVSSITRMAFYGCTGLTDITIPESVTFFGDDAFEGCAGLNTAGPVSGEYTIKYEWMESIPEWAFSTFSNLKEVTIVTGIRSIRPSAFTGCEKLIEISLPEGVSNIGEWAFSSCSGLSRVKLPKSMISIGNGAFFQCANLAEVYYSGMKADAETISVGTNNESLISATWHYKDEDPYTNNLTVRPVGDSTRAVVSGGSLSLQVEATAVDTSGLSYEWVWFDRPANYWKTIEGSGNYDSVTVNDITEDMSIQCVVTDRYGQRLSAQFNVYVNKPGHQCGVNLDWNLENGVLTVFGSGEMYQYFNEDGFRPPWAEQLDEIQSLVIENGVESVGDYAFSDAINLKNVSFADTVWIIGDHAFQRSGVRDIYLPDAKFLNINGYAFEGCQSLETVSIGKTPEKILEYAFSNCPNLHLITYRGLFNSIGQSEEFHGLTATIQYPCNIVELYRETYYSNANAMEGTNSATAISASTGEPVVTAAPTDDQILANIEATKRDIKMSNTKSNLTFEKFHTYEDGVCARCGERVPTIIRLPSGLNTVGSESFMSTAADQIIIPAGVNVIEPHAFYDCPNLKILYFEGDPETIAPEIVNEGVAIYCEPGGNVDSWAKNSGLATVYR